MPTVNPLVDCGDEELDDMAQQQLTKIYPLEQAAARRQTWTVWAFVVVVLSMASYVAYVVLWFRP
jgi:hypothetical protein